MYYKYINQPHTKTYTKPYTKVITETNSSSRGVFSICGDFYFEIQIGGSGIIKAKTH